MNFLKIQGSRAKLVILFFILELGLLAGLSDVSGYELKNPKYFINFEIITMLTPVGLFKNLILEPESKLRPFYDRISTREGVFDSTETLFFCLAIPILALAALSFLKREDRA